MFFFWSYLNVNIMFVLLGISVLFLSKVFVNLVFFKVVLYEWVLIVFINNLFLGNIDKLFLCFRSEIVLSFNMFLRWNG